MEDKLNNNNYTKQEGEETNNETIDVLTNYKLTTNNVDEVININEQVSYSANTNDVQEVNINNNTDNYFNRDLNFQPGYIQNQENSQLINFKEYQTIIQNNNNSDQGLDFINNDNNTIYYNKNNFNENHHNNFHNNFQSNYMNNNINNNNKNQNSNYFQYNKKQASKVPRHSRNTEQINSNIVSNINKKKVKPQFKPKKASLDPISMNGTSISKMAFINPYDKCNNFSNFKIFSALNLKFLKQNYKFKEFENEKLNHNKKVFNNINNNNASRFSINPLSLMLQNNINMNNNFNMENIQEQHLLNDNKNGNFYYNNTEDINRMIQMNIASSINNNTFQDYNVADLNNDDKMQPFTFVTDPKIIEDNLSTGRYLKGIIRINKCHTHGYITVEGLVNDILIRGNRNLNQSLHMDEVIVELFPMMCWKPLFNKKIRKFSVVQQSDKEENNYYTDVERDDDKFINDDILGLGVKNSENYNSDGAETTENNSNKYKENFTCFEERLGYINKMYNLRPEGRIVKIIKSPNYEKPQIVKIVNEKSLIFACPIDENLPKIFIKMKKFRRVEFLKKLENDYHFKNKYFLVRLVGWALNFKCPKGIIVNELGNCGDLDVETEVLLRTYEVNYDEDYPKELEEEISKYESK